MGLVFCGYQSEARNGQRNQIQLMHGVVPTMNGDEHFPISKIHISLFSRELEVVDALFLRASKTEPENKQFNYKEELPEQRYEVEDEVLVAKRNAFGVIKTSAFQSKWYGLCRVFTTNNLHYKLVTTNAKVSREPIIARQLRKYFRRPSYLFY